MGHEPGEDTVSEPNGDEVVAFEEFFTAGLRIFLFIVLLEL
jgi:hypothetical protein